MVTRGLTEKKMKNKRFSQTEKAIFVAYYQLRDYPNARKLARRAGISHTTLYRHHKSLQQIPKDYEDYLLKSFDTRIKAMLVRQQIELKTLYLRMLIFIHTNREVIKMLLKDGRTEVINKMVLKFRQRVILAWNLAGDLEKVYGVYRREVLGVIEDWGRRDFAKQEIEVVLDDIMHLTKTTPRRLSKLIGLK